MARIGSAAWYEAHPDAPDAGEAALIVSEVRDIAARRRAREAHLHTTEEWDRLNAKSIAQGFGPLPF